MIKKLWRNVFNLGLLVPVAILRGYGMIKIVSKNPEFNGLIARDLDHWMCLGFPQMVVFTGFPSVHNNPKEPL